MDWSSRDEMNWAEFPLAAVSDRVPRGVKTLTFEDRIKDRSKNRWITRRVTITGSDRYGLPTSVDDEVVLGLIQLANAEKFQSPRVYFSRYALIRLLGWRDEGKSYRRLSESLRRWLGVTLYYENAWWKNDAKAWVDESFHILEHVSIVRGRPSKKGDPAGLSSFVWNDVVFQSFKSGWIKPFNMEMYKKLRTPTAKRMLRFLDKRFHRSSTIQMDLRKFAEEHIGVRRGYDTAALKRRIAPAIKELATMRFLVNCHSADMYRRVQHGKWEINLQRGPAARRTSESRNLSCLERELVRRGITESQAVKLARDHDPKMIARQLASVDAMVSTQDSRISKNPAGFLVNAIRDNYVLPQPSTAQVGRKRRTPPVFVQRLPSTEEWRAERELEGYLKSLSQPQREAFEADAVAATTTIQKQGLQRAELSNNTRVRDGYRRAILWSHFLRIQNEQQSEAESRAIKSVQSSV